MLTSPGDSLLDKKAPVCCFLQHAGASFVTPQALLCRWLTLRR